MCTNKSLKNYSKYRRACNSKIIFNLPIRVPYLLSKNYIKCDHPYMLHIVGEAKQRACPSFHSDDLRL